MREVLDRQKNSQISVFTASISYSIGEHLMQSYLPVGVFQA